MANIHDDPAALKALQDDIYREKMALSKTRTASSKRLTQCAASFAFL